MPPLIRRNVSPAMAAANRANGRKSKGSVSEHGKAKVRANAGKHWGRAETVRELMPALGESPAEFDQTRAGLECCGLYESLFYGLLITVDGQLLAAARTAISLMKHPSMVAATAGLQQREDPADN